MTFDFFNLFYKSRLYLRNPQESPDTTNESSNAKPNPQGLSSMPLMRFMPNREEMSVGNIITILMEVRVRIVVFMLLLMMLE